MYYCCYLVNMYYLYHGNNKQYYEPCILFFEAKISGPQTIRSAADVLS